jgi:hypothetical protein
MSSIIDGLIEGYRRNQDYGERLLYDLTDEHMTMQPHGERERPVNHPAWAFSHMNVYLPVIQCVIRGERFEDPMHHRFGMNSRPETEFGIYGTRLRILADWSRGHEAVCELLQHCDNTLFGRSVHLERWTTVMPTAGVCLPYLMLNHENMHLGQISAWRRVLGLPSV